jgi:excisionase family DNA binding protein
MSTYLTVPEVREALRCTREYVIKLINAPGGLRASKVAGRWLIEPDDLAAYVETQANRPKPRQRRRRAS